MNINFKEILRWANKNKGVTILSISGMAIGIAIAIIIGIWSLNEFSFDSFHKDADRIYRICRQGFINNESVVLGTDFGPVAPTSKQKFPEIEDVTRLRPLTREVVKINNKINYEDQLCAADPNLFSFFSFKIEVGDPATCLDAPDKVVIDRYLANKYFHNNDPIGQMVEIYGKKFQVSAVMENLPSNSHINFRMLVPIKALEWLSEDQWGNNDSFIGYFKVNEGTDVDKLAKQINAMTYEHFPLYKQFELNHFLQPLLKIHLFSGFRFDNVITNDKRIIFIFISIALAILAIACFNFINLFISTSFQRAKSIGVKKINGSSKRSLFLASCLETTLYIITAAFISFIVVLIALPYFNHLAGTNLSVDLTDYRLYAFFLILVIAIIALAGSFPVFYILRFNPEEIIRNRFKGKNITLLQRVLVVTQFVASIMLIASAAIIKKQINYVHNKDLGFDKEQLIYFNPKNMAANFKEAREEMLKNPSITEVTAKSCLPNDWNNGNPVANAESPENVLIMEICAINHNYSEVMKIPVVMGRNPFTETGNNSQEIMLNEQAVKALELNDPIGKQIVLDEQRFTVAGVLKNVNTKSLHLQIDPQVYRPLDNVQGHHYVFVKSNGNTKSTIETMNNLWEKYNPDVPFEYAFLDEAYDKLYKNEEIASQTLSIGMVIALFLAFMGQYAISHYATERRIKEIGVRKVNGAKIAEVLVLLNKDFVKWILIACLIACPIAWYAMNKWLQNFAYRTEMSWWVFALAGIAALGIALLTVSFQSWKAATRNPVEALRYE